MKHACCFCHIHQIAFPCVNFHDVPPFTAQKIRLTFHRALAPNMCPHVSVDACLPCAWRIAAQGASRNSRALITAPHALLYRPVGRTGRAPPSVVRLGIQQTSRTAHWPPRACSPSPILVKWRATAAFWQPGLFSTREQGGIPTDRRRMRPVAVIRIVVIFIAES